MFGTAQQDLTGCGTGILGVVLVERGNTISGWIDLGKQGWLAQLGSGTDSTGFSREAPFAQLCFQEILFIHSKGRCVCVAFISWCMRVCICRPKCHGVSVELRGFRDGTHVVRLGVASTFYLLSPSC